MPLHPRAAAGTSRLPSLTPHSTRARPLLFSFSPKKLELFPENLEMGRKVLVPAADLLFSLKLLRCAE